MFIGLFGTGRNGSSLLTGLLDGLEKTYVHPNEIIFLSAINDLNKSHYISKKTLHFNHKNFSNKKMKSFNVNNLLIYYENEFKKTKDLIKDNLVNETNLDYKFTLKHKLMKSKDIIEFCYNYLEESAKWSSDIKFENYLFKTSEVSHLEKYQEIFPNMKFIHIIRNPLDVIDSGVRRTRENKNPLNRTEWYLGGDTILTMVKRWRIHSNFIIKNRNNKNHICIQYEDLIDNELDVINNISFWLGLLPPKKPTISTILYNNRLKRLPENIGSSNTVTPFTVNRNLKSKYGYKFSLENQEVDLIVYSLFQNAKYFGYFDNLNSISKMLILITWFLPKKFEFNNVSTNRRKTYTIYRILVRRLKIIFL